MKPGKIKNANIRLLPPPHIQEAGELMAYRNLGDNTISSLWMPTREELTALINGHGILLTVCSVNHPAVMLEVTGEPVC